MTENFYSDEFYTEEERAQMREQACASMKKEMRGAYNRVGFAVVLMMGVWLAQLFFVIGAVTIANRLGASIFGVSAAEIYNRSLLIINELTLAIAVFAGAVFLSKLPKAAVASRSVPFGKFMRVLCMCFAVSYVGNLIGNFLLSLWNSATGIEVTNELLEVIDGMDPLWLILCVGIAAPILEELFFRKLVIDRVRRFGEVPAMLISALLFALFHQSATQFLYTFGAGLLLAYFYVRTGNFLWTAVLHAVFNLVSGVLPTLLIPDILAFAAEIESFVGMGLSETELAAQMMPVLMEYAGAIMLYMLYSLVLLIINIIGIVCLFKGIKRFAPNKPEYSLSASETLRAVFVNPGMICALILLGATTVMSLFSV